MWEEKAEKWQFAYSILHNYMESFKSPTKELYNYGARAIAQLVGYCLAHCLSRFDPWHHPYGCPSLPGVTSDCRVRSNS